MDPSEELCAIFDESLDTMDLQSRRRSFMPSGRGKDKDNNKSKRKTFWGQMPLSPLVSHIEEQISFIKSSQSPHTISPGIKLRVTEDQNRNPNICLDNSTIISTCMPVASPSNDLRVLMSPIKEETPKANSGNSRKSIRVTPTPYKTRESVSYYTAQGSSVRNTVAQDTTNNSRNSVFCLVSNESVLSNCSLSSRRKSSEHFTSSKLLKIEYLEQSLSKALHEIDQLQKQLLESKLENGEISAKYASLEENFLMSQKESVAFYKEIQAQQFLNGILEQKVEGLECQISSDRLNQNESMSNKTRKYKQEIERLTTERKLYEERANAMCQQMTEQMALLQSTAMMRIEVRSYLPKSYHIIKIF